MKTINTCGLVPTRCNRCGVDIEVARRHIRDGYEVVCLECNDCMRANRESIIVNAYKPRGKWSWSWAVKGYKLIMWCITGKEI